jgi:hypothetical protein
MKLEKQLDLRELDLFRLQKEFRTRKSDLLQQIQV